MRTCAEPSVHCHQQVYGTAKKCPYHERRDAGLISRLEDYLTDVELDATMAGREHQDGRRLDHYVSDEDQP